MHLHMKGHIDHWCKENCDAKKFKELDNVRFYLCMHASLYALGWAIYTLHKYYTLLRLTRKYANKHLCGCQGMLK